MNPEIQNLQNRVTQLESIIKQLTFSSTITRNIENALTERLSLLTVQGTGAAGGTNSYSTFPVTVPAAPSGSLEVTFAGTNYKILYV